MRPTQRNGSTGESKVGLVDQCLVNTGTLAIGTFRAHPSHPNFRHAGRITEGPSIVFPRTSAWIQHEGKDPFVTDQNTVSYFNLKQPYIREKLNEGGEHVTDWFHFSPDVLAEAVRANEREVEDRLDRPFSFPYGPADERSFFLERIVFRHICEADRPDLLYVEEAMLRVLRRIIDNAYQYWGRQPFHASNEAKRSAKELAQHARAILAERICEPVSLTEIAQEIGISAFHLCRLFRRRCGTTIHQYRNQLRVRMAVDLLGEFRQDLTGLALHLGYSSHSHFTASFRQAFGCTPSDARNIRPSRLARS